MLGNEVDFEHRSPRPDDEIRLGMVDLQDGDRWIELGRTTAWCWQQGCMLQWLPGSKNEVIWNDRQDGRYVCHILNVETRAQRTIPHPVYAISPDGRWAVAPDFRRLGEMRPGYGYNGIPDPYAEQAAPREAGIWKIDLQTGDSRLLLSLADVVKVPFPCCDARGQPRDPAAAAGDFGPAKHWFNHLLVSPDGSRFEFLHRWKLPDAKGWKTRMLTAAPDGSDLRVLDDCGVTSHFIWRDPRHILAWSLYEKPGGFFVFEDRTHGTPEKVLMTVDGHCTYLPLPGRPWILCDTYPDRQRKQNPYLYHPGTARRVPLGHFLSPKEYSGERRCDTHPRASRDGRSVVIDSPHTGQGRQLHLIDIGSLIG